MSDFIPVQRKKGKKTQKPKEHVKRTTEECVDHYNRMVRFYKTERCKDGFGKPFPFCTQGKQCFYAHSEAELRRDPLVSRGVERYSRGMCQQRANCPNGKNCQYAHNDCETMYHPKTYKTKSCKHGSKCERGVFCAFQHEDDILTPELRGQLFLNKDPAAPASEGSDGGFSTDIPEQTEIPATSSPQPASPVVNSTTAAKQTYADEARVTPPAGFANVVKEKEIAKKEEEAAVTKKATPPETAFESMRLAEDNGVRSHASSSASVDSPLQQPALSPSPRLDPHRMKSASIVITMLSPAFKLLPDQAEAMLDILAATEEGRLSRDAQENTALLHAVSRGLHRLVPLLASPQTVNSHNSHAQTPISIAVEGDDRPMLEELLKCGANPNVGDGALNHAIKCNSMQCAFLLLKVPNVNTMILDKQGNSALALSAERGFEQLARQLCLQTSLLNVRNNNGETPLFLAALKGHSSVVVTLLQAGADPNVSNLNRTTPLMAALSSDVGLACVDILLQHLNIDVNAKDITGVTALFIAKRRGLPDVVRKLLDKGADADAAVSSSLPSFAAPGTGGGPLAHNSTTKSPMSSSSSTSTSSFLSSLGGTISSAGIAGSGPSDSFASAFSSTLQVPQREQQTCVICMLARPTVQNRPCNHVALCQSCATKWFATPNYCPLCSTMVEDYVLQSPPLINGSH